jgi:hypothetical protein
VGPDRDVPNERIAEEEVRLTSRQALVECAVFDPAQIFTKETFAGKPLPPPGQHSARGMSLRRRKFGPIPDGEQVRGERYEVKPLGFHQPFKICNTEIDDRMTARL